jgi:hypothetical protein
VIILFGSSFNPLFIRDKFGESLGGELAVSPSHSRCQSLIHPITGHSDLMATPFPHSNWRIVVHFWSKSSVADWCTTTVASHCQRWNNPVSGTSGSSVITWRTSSCDDSVTGDRRVCHSDWQSRLHCSNLDNVLPHVLYVFESRVHCPVIVAHTCEYC